MLRTPLLGCLLAFASLFAPVVAKSQPRIPNATMLKRIAEAVDGNRSGAPVYVVVSYDSAYEVQKVLASRTDAEQMARRHGAGYAVFGPYATTTMHYVIVPCFHDGMVSRLICADSLLAMDPDSVASWRLSVRMRGGAIRDIPLPAATDAIFLTPAALEKFAIPYYVRIVGVDSAAALRARSIHRRP